MVKKRSAQGLSLKSTIRRVSRSKMISVNKLRAIACCSSGVPHFQSFSSFSTISTHIANSSAAFSVSLVRASQWAISRSLRSTSARYSSRLMTPSRYRCTAASIRLRQRAIARFFSSSRLGCSAAKPLSDWIANSIIRSAASGLMVSSSMSRPKSYSSS